MPILQSTLTGYGVQTRIQKSDDPTNFSKVASYQTAFLSHSHKDATMAKGVQAFLQAQGLKVYIDWEDTTMPPSPTRETAERIQTKIRDLHWFFFLATQNSMDSRWCPWEIGYADGVKNYENIIVLPTSDGHRNHGNEYLQLYRHVNDAQGGGYGAFKPNGQGVKLAHLF